MEKGRIEFNVSCGPHFRCMTYDEILRGKERAGQIENFQHLIETLRQGDIKIAIEWCEMAIKKLQD